MVYVDGNVIKGDYQEGIKKLRQHLLRYFQTEDLGQLQYFLEIEATQSKTRNNIFQRKYSFDI